MTLVSQHLYLAVLDFVKNKMIVPHGFGTKMGLGHFQKYVLHVMGPIICGLEMIIPFLDQGIAFLIKVSKIQCFAITLP